MFKQLQIKQHFIWQRQQATPTLRDPFWEKLRISLYSLQLSSPTPHPLFFFAGVSFASVYAHNIEKLNLFFLKNIYHRDSQHLEARLTIKVPLILCCSKLVVNLVVPIEIQELRNSARLLTSLVTSKIFQFAPLSIALATWDVNPPPYPRDSFTSFRNSLA